MKDADSIISLIFGLFAGLLLSMMVFWDGPMISTKHQCNAQMTADNPTATGVWTKECHKFDKKDLCVVELRFSQSDYKYVICEPK